MNGTAADGSREFAVSGSTVHAVEGVVAGSARRAVLLLGASLFLTMLPVTMMVPVLKELVSERFHPTPFWAHSFMAINMIGAVLAAPIGGVLADRIGRRKPILVAALAVNAGLIFLMTQMTSLGSLLAVRFLEGAAHILSVSTIMAAASDWTTSSNRGRTMGLIGATLMLGTAFGSMLGGRIGEHSPLLVLQLGSCFALAAAMIVAVGIPESPGRRRLSNMWDALRLIGERRALLVPYAYAFIDRLCVGVIVSSFVLYLGEVHSISPAQRGGLLAMFMFPFALLCYPVGRLSDRYGRALPMCVGTLLFGLVFASYGLIPIGWMPAAMLVSGVLSAIMFAPNLAMCSDLSPADQRAVAFAGFNVAGSLGFICGPLLGGFVCGVVAGWAGTLASYRTVFVAAGLTEVLCVLISIPWLLSLRRTGRIR